MKKRWLLPFVLLLWLGIAGGIVGAQGYRAPAGYVNDFAGILSPATISQLEEQLTQLETETTAEVAVVTVPSLEGDTVEGYAAGLFEAWQIGKADKDNGVLFLIAPTERQVRIEVGYGLEPIITDGRAGRILDREVIPYFKNNDYDRGIINGASAIEDYIRANTPPGFPEGNPVQSFVDNSEFFMPAAIGLGVLTIYLAGFMARSKSFWFGGVWGVLVGFLLGLAWGNLGGLIVLPIGLGLFGLLLDYILSRNYKSLSSGGRSTNWTSSWGGFRGGGSSGGSFGGFGGGHSGGGGASRGW